MIPHSWVVKCLRMFEAESMVLCLERSMNQWQVELSAGGRTLGSINVRRRIFQGDCKGSLNNTLRCRDYQVDQRRAQEAG